jgi:Ferrochelatase
MERPCAGRDGYVPETCDGRPRRVAGSGPRTAGALCQIGLGDEPSAESPHLTRWTLRQTTLLEERLGKTVYVGNEELGALYRQRRRKDEERRYHADKGDLTRSENSRTSVGLYKRAIENAAGDSMEVEFISGWADHPLLVKAFAHRTRVALNKARTSAEDKVAVLFTAHSVSSRTVLPSSKPVEYHGMFLANGPDSYADDCKLTAKLVASTARRRPNGLLPSLPRQAFHHLHFRGCLAYRYYLAKDKNSWDRPFWELFEFGEYPPMSSRSSITDSACS